MTSGGDKEQNEITQHLQTQQAQTGTWPLTDSQLHESVPFRQCSVRTDIFGLCAF